MTLVPAEAPRGAAGAGGAPGTLISLLGEQAHPALILALHLGVSSLHVLPGQGMEGRADDLVAAAREAAQRRSLPLEVTVGACVTPYDWTAVERTVGAALDDHPGAWVDLTGGTKPMTVGACRAADARGRVAVYLDTGGRRVVPLSLPAAVLPETPLPELEADVLVRAQGAEMVRGCHHVPLTDIERAVCRDFVRTPERWRRLQAAFQGQAPAVIRHPPQVLHFVEAAGLKDLADALVGVGAAAWVGLGALRFASNALYHMVTTGAWLEAWIADALLQVTGGPVLRNASCRMRPGRDGTAAADAYECDVAVAVGSVLHVVSCKAGTWSGWEHVQAWRDAGRRLGGLHCRVGVAAVGQTKRGTPPHALTRRARDLGIAFWGSNALRDPAAAMRDWLWGADSGGTRHAPGG
jgi:hypothetical protein